ncbi:MAG: DUF2277 domain-containing protein [Deferribacteres bacterium]|nr:DUF2277 domain-containing protein [candidate division KSB1 bacterium]MCB9509189.1 DUF2277 domain-containing protein [Deferribacteres bacterium]
MCRNIKRLHQPESKPTDEELYAAALQFVRKITGYNKPSQANAEAFEQAIVDITATTRVLFDKLIVRP